MARGQAAIRTRQPADDTLRIAWDNPLTRDLALIQCGRRARIINSNAALTKAGSPTVRATSRGRSYDFAGAQALKFAQSVSGSSPAAATMFALVAADVAAASTEYTVIGQSSTSQAQPLFRLEANNQKWALQARGNAGTFYTISDSANITVGRFYLIVGVYRSGTGQKELWVDGKLVATSTTDIGTVTLEQTEIGVLQRVTPAQYFDGAIPTSGIFTRALRAGEIRALSAKPWQLIARQRRRLRGTLAAAGLSGDAQSAATASGTITQSTAIAGAAVSVASATGVMTSAASLTGAAAAMTIAEGNASLTISMSAAALATALADAQLAMAQTLSGTAQGQAAAAADLTGGSDLSGAASGSSTAAAQLSINLTLSGAAIAQALAEADLTIGDTALQGAAQASSTAAAALFSVVPLLGAASVQVTAAGGLASQSPLAANAEAIVNAGGDLMLSVALSAAALSAAQGAGSVTITVALGGEALAQALATAAFAAEATWSGLIIENYTLKAPERNYTLKAPERNYTLTVSA